MAYVKRGLCPTQTNQRPRMHKGLVTNYGEGGGLQNWRGACEVLPLQKGGKGRKKSFSHARMGAQNVLGYFFLR